VLGRAGMYPRYVPSGHLICVFKGTLFAVPFDPTNLAVHGHPAPMVADVSNDTGFGFARFDFSANGMLLYRRGRTQGAENRPLDGQHWPNGRSRNRTCRVLLSPRLPGR
jgi:hypothetical protein